MLSRFVITAIVTLLASCTPATMFYPPLSVRSSAELLYLHGYRAFVIAGTDGGAYDVATSAQAAIWPRFSPDGRKIAYIDVGAGSLPNSSTRVSLHIFSVQEDSDFDGVSIALPQLNADNRLMIDDAVPPLWEPGGQSVLVGHGKGIDRITLTGDISTVVTDEDIFWMANAPDGRLALSNGKNILFMARDADVADVLLPDDVVPTFGDTYIRCFAFSPDGDRVAFAYASSIYMMELATGEFDPIYRSSAGGIYWMDWFPDEEQLVFLAGHQERRGTFIAPFDGNIRGSFELATITTRGKNYFKLLYQRNMDVREAVPAVSPDGVLVSITAKMTIPREVLLIDPRQGGVKQLTVGGPSTFATWRPVTATVQP